MLTCRGMRGASLGKKSRRLLNRPLLLLPSRTQRPSLLSELTIFVFSFHGYLLDSQHNICSLDSLTSWLDSHGKRKPVILISLLSATDCHSLFHGAEYMKWFGTRWRIFQTISCIWTALNYGTKTLIHCSTVVAQGNSLLLHL